MFAIRRLASQAIVLGKESVHLRNLTQNYRVRNVNLLRQVTSFQSSNRLFSTDEKLPEAPEIDVRDVEKIVENRNLILLDVRTAEEFNREGFIPTAVHVHVEELEDALKLDDGSFISKYGFSKPKKSDHIVVYCKKGIRSTRASGILLKHDFKNIQNFKGSWLVWGARNPKDVKAPPRD